ncbi:MAG: efflux RND transporter permease subunit [Bacteroidota bacterium]|jgi:multidrug efflux pump subunit AcrB|nr:efflux RND transporter permease subunit [Cytophagales bacterium]
MLRHLLQRPIAISMTLLVALVLSVVLYLNLPVSLLPDLDVPEITIAVRYPNASPEEIEQNLLKPIREAMLTLNGLKTTESMAQNETGKVSLRFDYGTVMNLAYIEANEKIDRLIPLLPRNLERPTVVKSSTSNIPMARIQVVPKIENDLLATSELATKVLKRRLEQLEGVGLVDVNGTQERVMRVAPDEAVMQSLSLTDNDLIKTIQNSNLALGSLSVKDGNYRYFLKLASPVRSPEEMEGLPIKLPGNAGAVQLGQVAKIYLEPAKQLGYHLFQSQEGIVITIHKQAQARLPELMPKIYSAVEQFRLEYPQLGFAVTQDQSLLLTLSIQNLSQALVWGGLIAFGVLFLFMRGWREPLIMGIVLPLSLLLAFSIFALFHISLNVISLSGLALGLGMLVDNSIVVIDSIMLKQREGNLLLASCVAGTQEVIAPLISSALTNLVVFTPLIFLSGITGALFYDQAVSVAAILSVSLLCTFLVVPLLYLLFFKNKSFDTREDSSFFLAMKSAYKKSFEWVWSHKKVSVALISLLIPTAIVLTITLPKEGLPQIERKETVISVDWNEPIGAEECRDRVDELIFKNRSLFKTAEAEVGYQQFLLSSESFSAQHAEIYLAYTNPQEKEKGDDILKKYFQTRFPLASAQLRNAPNAFEQLFVSGQPLMEARFRDLKSKQVLSILRADSLLNSTLKKVNGKASKGFEKETMAFLHIDFAKLQQYGIAYETIIEKLKLSFGEYLITDFTDFDEVLPVVFQPFDGDLSQALQNLRVPTAQGIHYPVQELIQVEFRESYRFITADASGIFQSVGIEEVQNFDELKSSVQATAKAQSVIVEFAGKWFENEKNFKQLTTILLISMLLMYVILTAEFESLKQPFLVMITLPLGLAGSLLLLWVTGGTLNIMSGIGLIVVLGVLDNDAILKIDRINRLRETLPLEQAIRQAGLDRLKPIVMNTCTNVLAITPIIFSSGLGADLQRPVAITTIGGLIVGTFTALYFVPLLYWYFVKAKEGKAN